jgi:hypothetical protein
MGRTIHRKREKMSGSATQGLMVTCSDGAMRTFLRRLDREYGLGGWVELDATHMFLPTQEPAEISALLRTKLDEFYQTTVYVNTDDQDALTITGTGKKRP